jgi:uncharacterized protein
MAALDPFLLEIVVCPETKSNLTLAPPELVRAINGAIEKGTLVDRGGQRVKEKIEGALVRQDNEVAYPIHDGIPTILVERQLLLRQIR